MYVTATNATNRKTKFLRNGMFLCDIVLVLFSCCLQAIEGTPERRSNKEGEIPCVLGHSKLG